MTPERIEAYKTMIRQLGALPPSAAIELLAALEESQQRIGKLELYVKSLEFNRDDTQKRANEKLRERDTKLVEAQKLNESLNEESLANFREAAKRGKLLAEAQQTIARQREALESARNTMEDALSVGEARYKDFDTRLCPWADLSDGVENIEAALGKKEGSDKAPQSTSEGGECTCVDCGGLNSSTWVCKQCQDKRDQRYREVQS
ncbi:hypothetical protein [Paenibacillus sp. FSL R10-2734]|uniref:hypothetical protein n=1 Tax=Paenibacillus sp. FSL R10-2734 TaxID=2954691 RepID=UPI0030DBE2C8